jgi:predicted esterase
MKMVFRMLAGTALVLASVVPGVANDGQILRGETHASPGTAQARYILIKPHHDDPARKYPLFIFLHGQGNSPESTLESDAALFTRQEFFILLPRAPDPRGGGFSWYNLADANQLVVDLSRDERLLKAMIEEVTTVHNIDRSHIVLSGFSSGGRLCFYVGFRNPKLFAKIVPVGGYYMPNLLDSQLANLNGLKVSIYHGTEDTVNPFDRMKESCENLRRKGVAVTLTTYPLGHTYTPEILKQILGEVE